MQHISCSAFHKKKMLFQFDINVSINSVFLKSQVQRSENEATYKNMTAKDMRFISNQHFHHMYAVYHTQTYVTCIWYYCVFGIVAFKSYENNAYTALFFLPQHHFIRFEIKQNEEKKIAHSRRLKTWFGSFFSPCVAYVHVSCC